MQTRRQFVQTAAAASSALLLSRCSMLSQAHTDDAWSAVPDILARIKPPRFPDRVFNITQYDAVGDGKTDNTMAFAKAIDACVSAGGGRVLVPAGRFQTGPIHLRSNVELHVARGGIIAFDRDPAKYLPRVLTRFEGVELMNYSPFIYAFEQDSIAITGAGTLDGQAVCDAWWDWKGDWEGAARFCTTGREAKQVPARTRLIAMMEKGVPPSLRVFGPGDYLRPNFIQPYRCKNVLIEGVTIINSPMWEVHPVLCTNVTVRGVKINSHGPNNDGCDPESCRDVLIEDCEFDTGDDCIAIKSGRNADGRRINVPSENIIVRGCRMKDGHGGVTIGSEISGGTRNVFAEHNVMDSPNLDRALRLKNNAMRGGVLENIFMRETEIGQVSDSVLSVDFYYEEGAKGGFTPVVRNVVMSDITSKKSKYGLYLRGFENAPIYDISLRNCRFDNVAKGNVVEHVERLRLDNVRINGELTKSP